MTARLLLPHRRRAQRSGTRFFSSLSGRAARCALLGIATAFSVLAQYTYDGATWSPGGSTSSWQANGGASFGSSSITFGTGGSIISKTSVSGNSNDYEVESQFVPASGANYVHFLRANSTSVQAGTGSYISVELDVATFSGNPGGVQALLVLNQCINGSVTYLGSLLPTFVTGTTNTFRTVAFSNNLWVYVNGQIVWWTTIPQTTGIPGIGAYGSTPGAFTQVAIGHHDTIAPFGINAAPVASSIFPGSVSLEWPVTTDDRVGIGMLLYDVFREVGQSGTTLLGYSVSNQFTDETASPGTSYIYTVWPVDEHGNAASPLTMDATTPPAPDINPRRIGVQKNGSYWGGGGEQIDTLSGNLNFSIPVITPQERTGQKFPLGLSYNSQNWLQDAGYNWQLGTDSGYGFGWTMQFGSITPYYGATWEGVDHYVFTDGTGAQYTLNVNNNNVWSSSQSVYMWFDAKADRLHFTDGSFWQMGCTSGGTEADFGTMYPTIIEDSNGNQIQIQYAPAYVQYPPSAPFSTGVNNTSSRFSQITDFTGTYNFSYSSTGFAFPHLSEVVPPSGVPGYFSMTYSTCSLSPPFGSDSRYSGATTVLLTSLTPPLGSPYTFTYDSASAGPSPSPTATATRGCRARLTTTQGACKA